MVLELGFRNVSEWNYLEPLRVDSAYGINEILVQLNPPKRRAAVQPVARL